ncbi:LysR family transcriptional regulator [Peredibacter starrii]|uniref:LysR family transcriptional regulator n=1 Tax=Peredibacter starrii TaxID=28202 RepID=A0AAX4HT62_9BACT|nr:LysR family transcriptional regulator [Peredibacter starrii]WPU66591.1 LysR family transcriptional regulator [Peredibacter starrii]
METMSLNAYLPDVLAFYEVAKCGGFTQAAEKMNLSKAQLSKQVARLETILRAQLFFRTTRKINLTEEGKHLLQYAESIVKLSHDAAESMKELVDEEGGLIRITAPSSLADSLAPPLIKMFNEKLPNLKVEIEASNVKRDLIAEGYDFALRAIVETDPELVARYIGHIKDVIVATPDYVKKNKIKGIDPSELKDIPVLMASLRKSWNTWKFQKGNKDFSIDVHGNYASSSYQTNRWLCLSGLGVARLPYYLVENDLQDKKLTLLYKDYSIATHPLYLVYPSKGYRAKKNKIAKDLIWSWLQGAKGSIV